MEHRYHVRVPIDVKTLIYKRGLPIATGRIRDASPGGLFIETDCADMLENRRLQCEIRVAEDAEDGLRRVAVSVVRRVADGAGVELDEGDAHLASAMIAFYNSTSGGAWPR